MEKLMENVWKINGKCLLHFAKTFIERGNIYIYYGRCITTCFNEEKDLVMENAILILKLKNFN